MKNGRFVALDLQASADRPQFSPFQHCPESLLVAGNKNDNSKRPGDSRCALPAEYHIQQNGGTSCGEFPNWMAFAELQS